MIRQELLSNKYNGLYRAIIIMVYISFIITYRNVFQRQVLLIKVGKLYFYSINSVIYLSYISVFLTEIFHPHFSIYRMSFTRVLLLFLMPHY